MRVIELEPPESDVEAALETAFEGFVVSRSTLKAYPGSTHWHLRSPGQPGVLEVTWWPTRHRLWLSVHANREGKWIEEAIPLIVRRIAATRA